jgi:hypothetical protein
MIIKLALEWSSFSIPQGDWSLHIYMIGFVDDTSGSSNDFTRDQMADPEYYLNLANMTHNYGTTF